MKLGVCADPELAPVLAQAGFDFIELNVQGHLKSVAGEEAFVSELARIQAAALPAPAANCFVPGNIKITGPEANLSVLEDYVTTALGRAERAGMDTIVFGSGGARSIPEGFDRAVAWDQLVAFGKLCGPIAAQHNVMIVVEPLNQRECNVLTSVRECGEYVKAVDHPNVQLLVDTYHWAVDDHDDAAIIEYGQHIRHVHIATRDNRLPPGFEDNHFSKCISALKSAGYDGRVSIESKWDDMEAQAGQAHKALAELVTAAGFTLVN